MYIYIYIYSYVYISIYPFLNISFSLTFSLSAGALVGGGGRATGRDPRGPLGSLRQPHHHRRYRTGYEPS